MPYTPIQDHAASVALQDLKIVAGELAAAADHLNQADEYAKFLPTVERLENQIAALIGRITLHRQRLNGHKKTPGVDRILAWDKFFTDVTWEDDEDDLPI